MRKIILLLVVFTIFIWLAIAVYWTGTGSVKPVSAPAVPAISPEPLATPTSATSSATPSATPSVKLVIPTVNIGLKY